MAKRTITILMDDLDGTDIPRGLGETVRFGIDGCNYEIDLTDENAAALRESLSRYLEAGRVVHTPSPSRRSRR